MIHNRNETARLPVRSSAVARRGEQCLGWVPYPYSSEFYAPCTQSAHSLYLYLLYCVRALSHCSGLRRNLQSPYPGFGDPSVAKAPSRTKRALIHKAVC
jgi:hypothetical protein